MHAKYLNNLKIRYFFNSFNFCWAHKFGEDPVNQYRISWRETQFIEHQCTPSTYFLRHYQLLGLVINLTHHIYHDFTHKVIPGANCLNPGPAGYDDCQVFYSLLLPSGALQHPPPPAVEGPAGPSLCHCFSCFCFESFRVGETMHPWDAPIIHLRSLYDSICRCMFVINNAVSLMYSTHYGYDWLSDKTDIGLCDACHANNSRRHVMQELER